MKKNYMEIIVKTLDDANRKALWYGDGKAWDNRKKKIYARHTPRGNVYQRLREQEWKSMYNKMLQLISDVKNLKDELNGWSCNT